MRKVTFLLAAAAAISSFGLLGCGGGGDDTTASPCFDYSTFKSDTPAVKFGADVLPILRQSCGLSASCHGDISSPSTSVDRRPYLGPANGPAPTPAEITAIFSANVGVKSKKEPSMDEIAAGDPEKSFLMYKADGLLKCSKLPCASGDTCGVAMPQGSDLIPQAQRDTIRRWIAQGAKND